MDENSSFRRRLYYVSLGYSTRNQTRCGPVSQGMFCGWCEVRSQPIKKRILTDGVGQGDGAESQQDKQTPHSALTAGPTGEEIEKQASGWELK